MYRTFKRIPIPVRKIVRHCNTKTESESSYWDIIITGSTIIGAITGPSLYLYNYNDQFKRSIQRSTSMSDTIYNVGGMGVELSASAIAGGLTGFCFGFVSPLVLVGSVISIPMVVYAGYIKYNYQLNQKKVKAMAKLPIPDIPDKNWRILYHATDSIGATGIKSDGRINPCTSSPMYGPGVYFCNNVNHCIYKARSENVTHIVIAQVDLGCPFITDQPMSASPPAGYDSVIGTYGRPEYVVSDQNRIKILDVRPITTAEKTGSAKWPHLTQGIIDVNNA